MSFILTIATPLLTAIETGAQQALPPPPTIPNGSQLPSLAPIAPPQQVAPLVPPTGFPPPQGSIYQSPAPVPGTAPGTAISPQGTVPGVRMSYYQVIVPTQEQDIPTIANKMVAMGVRPDAIQARKVPLGPHLAIGPFIEFGEADSVSRYLRSGGMDARVYFQR